MPGELDPELNEFWSGNPWEIFEKHNLSCYERNRIYLSTGKSFIDISYLSGADSDGDARSVLPIDFNHDGQMDLAVRGAGGGALMLYRNQFPTHSYLQVSLWDAQSANKLGIGAKLVARVGGRRIVRERFPTNSHHSQRPLAVHFGLGRDTQVDTLEVHWPDGKKQELAAVRAGQHIVVVRGDNKVHPVSLGKRGALAR